MRSIKRWIRLNYTEYRISVRLDEIGAELSKLTGNKIYFERFGSRGQDSIYIVFMEGRKFGVLRLCNPWRKKKIIDPLMPYALLDPGQRLAREWNAYEVGAMSGLTPKPIWRSSDAILCEYISLCTMHNYLLASPDNFWELVMQASITLGQLHALGLTHMDASLANILADKGLTKTVIIDFEFSPAHNLSMAQQRAYDYLRLIESSLKFIPAGMNKDNQNWLALLKSLMADYSENTDVSPLLPALPRLVADPDVWPKVQALFYKSNH